MSTEPGPEGIDPVESQRTAALTLAMSTYLQLMRDTSVSAGTRKEAADKIMDIYDRVLAHTRNRGAQQPPTSAFLALFQSPAGSAALAGLSRFAALAAPQETPAPPAEPRVEDLIGDL
jgi:hypothetical protein